MEYTFTSENFDKEVLQSDKPVLVDFYADWCGPCKMAAPMIEAFAKEYEGKIKVGKLNVDEESEIAGRYAVMSIPTFLFIKDGEVKQQMVGLADRDTMKNALEALL